MFEGIISFALRMWLIAAVWAVVWRYVKPKSQSMRLLRAALLVLGLLGVLAVTRITGW